MRDAVWVSCLEDESGAVKVRVDDRKKFWKEHMEKLMMLKMNGVTALMLLR